MQHSSAHLWVLVAGASASGKSAPGFRGPLLGDLRYCITFDTQPMVDDAVHVFRTP